MEILYNLAHSKAILLNGAQSKKLGAWCSASNQAPTFWLRAIQERNLCTGLDFTIQAIRFRDCHLKVWFPCARNKVARNCGAKSVEEWNTKNLVLTNEFIKVELTSWKIWKADFSSVSSSWNFHVSLSHRCTTVSLETRILYNISIYTLLIYLLSINLLVVYRESVNLIGYITRRLSADSLQLWIANENRSPIYSDQSRSFKF